MALEPGTYHLLVSEESNPDQEPFELELKFSATDQACIGINTTHLDPVSQTISFFLEAGQSHFNGSGCQRDGPDKLFRIFLDKPTRMHAKMEGLVGGIYLRKDACDNEKKEILCELYDGEISGSLPPGGYYLVVDASRNRDEPQQVNLHLEFSEEPTLACEARFDAITIDAVSQALVGRLPAESKTAPRVCERDWDAWRSGEHIYAFKIDRPTKLVATLRFPDVPKPWHGWDYMEASLYLRQSRCDPESEIACEQTWGKHPGARWKTTLSEILQPGEYFLFADAERRRGDEYDYHLDLTFEAVQ